MNSVSDLTIPPASKDNCVNAISIGDVADLTFDTRNATFDGPGLCLISANIWYCYTASCTGDVTVSLAGSSYDTMLAVYNGCQCYPTSDGLIDCNDDAHASYQSEVNDRPTAGNQYPSGVAGYGQAQGAGGSPALDKSSAPFRPESPLQSAPPAGSLENVSTGVQQPLERTS